MATDEARTPREVFKELGEVLVREPNRTAGITALYQYEISGEEGGKWYVRIVDGKAEVVEGQADNPGCIICMTDTDYVAMATKRLSGAVAFATGKLRVKGSTGLAIKAAKIFG